MSQTGAGTGVMGTPEEIAYEARAAEGSIWTGGRLLVGVFAFAFAALGFAYFYLRSANSEGLWRPHGMTAPTGTGTAIMALALVSAVLVSYGLQRLRRGAVLDWEVAGWAVVGAGMLAFALQIWELTDLPFFPGQSGYASCFVAWAAMNLVLLLAGVYWVETLLARHIRLRLARTEEGADPSAQLTPRIFRVNLEACAFFWGFIAFISLFFWVFLYIAA
ncbi:MAG: hypothetical protein ACRDY3_03595 [Acidimicrobiales bacterium]